MQNEKNNSDSRPLYTYVAVEPCVMSGCLLAYGHVGRHDYKCAWCAKEACDGTCQD